MLLEVDTNAFVWGKAHRLSNDVPVRALLYALYKSHLEKDNVMLQKLLAIAKAVKHYRFLSALMHSFF